MWKGDMVGCFLQNNNMSRLFFKIVHKKRDGVGSFTELIEHSYTKYTRFWLLNLPLISILKSARNWVPLTKQVQNVTFYYCLLVVTGCSTSLCNTRICYSSTVFILQPMAKTPLPLNLPKSHTTRCTGTNNFICNLFDCGISINVCLHDLCIRLVYKLV